MGEHASLAPRGGSVAPDPLVVYPIEGTLADAEESFEDGEGFLVVAPDDLQKSKPVAGSLMESRFRTRASTPGYSMSATSFTLSRTCGWSFAGADFPATKALTLALPPKSLRFATRSFGSDSVRGELQIFDANQQFTTHRSVQQQLPLTEQ